MKADKQKDSYTTESSDAIGHGVIADDNALLSWQTELTSEFCDLIYESDPGASNDDYYVKSASFVQLHSQIRSGLLQGLSWLAIGLGVVVTAISFVYL